jgi:hypothetical protein
VGKNMGGYGDDFFGPVINYLKAKLFPKMGLCNMKKGLLIGSAILFGRPTCSSCYS